MSEAPSQPSQPRPGLKALPPDEPPSSPLTVFRPNTIPSALNNQPVPAKFSDDRRSRWPLILFALALAGGAAAYFLPVRSLIQKYLPAAARAAGASAAAGASEAARTLTIRPGLRITCTGDVPIQFTAARIYNSGREVPCMRGWLGVTAGEVDAKLPSAADDSLFTDSTLRLRFTAAPSGPKALSVSVDEGNPDLHELRPSDAVTEFIYKGGPRNLNLTIRGTHIQVADASPQG